MPPTAVCPHSAFRPRLPLPHRLLSLTLVLTALSLTLLLSGAASGQATTNVPVPDLACRHVERLVAEGRRGAAVLVEAVTAARVGSYDEGRPAPMTIFDKMRRITTRMRRICSGGIRTPARRYREELFETPSGRYYPKNYHHGK